MLLEFVKKLKNGMTRHFRVKLSGNLVYCFKSRIHFLVDFLILFSNFN